MNKTLKTIGIIALILTAGGLAVPKLLESRPAAPADYTQKTETGGPVEAKYMGKGGHEVSVYQEPALQGFSRYTICYPSDLETTDKTYPVIVLSNGSGTPVSKYLSVPEHFASWGFIVIGTEEAYDWNGFGAEMCIRHLQKLNDNEKIGENENRFYQKVDFEKVGIVGHSQGGVGVFNAITEQRHGDLYKAAVSLSPTNKKLAHDLEWDYDAAQIDTPVLLLSGAGGGDDWVVTGEQLEEIYNDVSGSKVMLRRKDTPHGEMLYAANGYVTAWFMYWLQADREAGKAFWGDAPEIAANPLYQDPKIRLAE